MISNVNALIVIRFLLGVVESAVMPSMLVFLSMWFTKSERSRANTFLILGIPVTILWMSVLSGYLIDSVGWRWMFILEGLPAIIWAFLWWKLVSDRPADAKWLTNDEKNDLQAQLVIKPVKNYSVAFSSRIVILLCLQYALWCIGWCNCTD
jgi:MFS family permease